MMRCFLGVFEDGTVVLGKAESAEDFVLMATLGNKDKSLRMIDVTDVFLKENANIIEFNPWKGDVDK